MNTPPAKMDKSRNVRRGTRKPQQHSSANLMFGFSGGEVDFEKAKKEKIRKLSSVNGIQHSKTETSNFCCRYLSSDNRENQCPSRSQLSSPLISESTTKRFKIPRKISDNSNVVDHASVPRKLRSSMKKRGDEAVSPHSPYSNKQNGSLNEAESHRKDGPKKPKLNLKQGQPYRSKKAIVSAPITKDEEEVAETLYALAGMFPDDDSMEVRSLVSPEMEESPVALLEVKKDDPSSVQAATVVPSSTMDESSNEADKLDPLNEPYTREQPGLPASKKLHFKHNSTISEMRTDTGILFFKSKPDAEKSCIHGDRGVLSESSLIAGLKQPKQKVTNLFQRKTEMEFGVMDVESRGHMIRELGKNGLALWPSLPSIVPLAPRSPSSSRSVANTIPKWLDAANYGPQTCSLETGSSSEKVLKITGDRNAMKRSATHVYISRLIHSLQMQGNKDGILQQPPWLKPNVGSKQTSLWYPNNCSNIRNAITGNVPGSTSGNTATDRNSYEARSGIIPSQKMLQLEQPRTVSASGMNTSKGQSFDILSLSAGGVGIDANSNSSEVCNAMGSTSQLQVPHLHLNPQHQSLMPFSISPTDYTSSACMDHLSTATETPQVYLQLPQYHGNPFCDPPYTSHSVVKKQQQQRLWAAHLAAQYQPHGTSTVLTQFSSRQNGKPELPTSMPSAQTAVPSHTTLEALGPKYYSVSQYHQPKIAYTSSLPPTRVKRTDHHFSSVYDESNGGFSADRPLPLQLLRN
ncbi:uncharacterized protein LOC120160512 [Hibiscus syriacus]|uniref:uncharacterized protein LOC120160512 n=1 Tax=Hibiscus syriacus TaxID=106335 RepID=UPI0019241A22|nr:uncharacterized protein LOC120160512 [Hibiscus syriacus]